MRAVVVVTGESTSPFRRALEALSHQRVRSFTEAVIGAPPDECEAIHREVDRQVGFPARILANPGIKRSSGFDLALGAIDSELIVRVATRSLMLSTDYMCRCVAQPWCRSGVGIVSGAQASLVNVQRPMAVSIGRTLSNASAVGDAPYRTGRAGEGDKAYLGVYGRDELVAIGGWDQRLNANESCKLGRRYRGRCQAVWVDDAVVVSFEAHDALFELSNQYRDFVRSKVAHWRTAGALSAARQVVALSPASIVPLVSPWPPIRHRPTALGLALAGSVSLAVFDQARVRGRPTRSQRLATLIAYAAIWSCWVAEIVESFWEQRAGDLRRRTAIPGNCLADPRPSPCR